MELNPILVREVRARWRKWPAFAFVFGYAIILAIGAALGYDSIAGREIIETQADQSRSSQMGAELFYTINWLQAIAWLLIAPLLTVSSITAERQSGLLDQLHTSPLTPWQIASGKMGAALSFIALMLLVPLPVVALCFLLGGVSPGEFIAAACLQAGLATACAANGLMSSSMARRTTTAIAIAVGLTLAWLWAGMYASFFLLMLFAFMPLSLLTVWGVSLLTAWGDLVPAVLAPLIWMLIVTWACLKSTAASLLKPMQEYVPYQPLRPAPTGDAKFDRLALEAYGVLKQRYDTPGRNSDAAERRYSTVMASYKGGNRPSEQFSRMWTTRIKNPILRRDLRDWLYRITTTSGAYLDGCLVITLYCFFMALLLANRVSIWFLLTYGWLVAVVITGCLIGALNFTREREQSTLESLFLSQLRTIEIIGAKAGSPLTLSTLPGLIFSPILLFCLEVWSINQSGITLEQAASSLMLIATVAWCATMFGLCCGWFARSTLAALCVAVGVPFFMLIALPALISAFSSTGEPLAWWHPFVALGSLKDISGFSYLSNSAALLHFLAGSAFFAVLLYAARHGVRQK